MTFLPRPLVVFLLLCVAASLFADHPSKGAAPLVAPLKTPKPQEKKRVKKKSQDAKKPATPALKPAAVLLSGANLDFCGQFQWTGGAENHRREVREFTELLKKSGVASESISDEDIKKGKLWDYRVLYVIDTFAIDKSTVEKIQDFVRGGGVLVAVGEVGRYQNGGWAQTWPFSEVFGLKMRSVDEYGTGVSRDGFLYRQAVPTDAGKKSLLLKGIGEAVELGPLAQAVWVTEADGAEVLAAYPKYMRVVVQLEGNKKNETVAEPIPAVSLNKFERGTAIYVSVLPGDRKEGRLLEVADLGAILKNAQTYASGSLVKISKPPPEPVLAYSQAGYLPGQQKHAVLSADPSSTIHEPHFTVYRHPSGEKVLEGKMTPFAGRFWNAQEWSADFSEITKAGSYWLEAGWKQRKDAQTMRSAVFEVDPDLYRLRLIPSQFSFFHEYRCGDRCHSDSPLPGGYHDATGDWSVRMWSMPAVVYGLARYLEVDPASSDAAREELAYALDWCLKMQGENGEVYEGVIPPNEKSNNNVRPWQEKAPRTVQKKDNFGYRLAYIAGLARAAAALKEINPELSKKTLEAAIKSREFTVKDAEGLKDTGGIGNWIWGNMELHRATGDAKYLDEAKKFAEIQLKRQHRRNDEVKDAVVCGDFFDGEDLKDFGRHQYKTFHQLGVYAGLIELHAALPPTDPLWWPVHAALERLMHGYFKPMSSVTPYGLVGKALERTDPNQKFQIYFFDNAKAWEGSHFGYNSDYLAEGLMALDYARQTGQPEMIAFAEDQVEWVLGNNPLGYSMVDGIGSRIAPMIDDKLGTGRVFGGIPNGFEGEGEKNLPIWGETWNSREYWLPHNAFFLPLAAELQWKRNIPAPDVPFSWTVEKSARGYDVWMPTKQRTEHKLELLVEGGELLSKEPATIQGGMTTWSVKPAGNEPLVLLLRNSEKPEIYLQKFIANP